MATLWLGTSVAVARAATVAVAVALEAAFDVTRAGAAGTCVADPQVVYGCEAAGGVGGGAEGGAGGCGGGGLMA